MHVVLPSRHPPSVGSPSPRSSRSRAPGPSGASNMIRKPISSPAVGTCEGFHGSSQAKGTGRRLLSLLLASTAVLPEASDSQKALLQKFLEKSKVNKAKNDKERLDSYYKRNYKDYFELLEGSNSGKNDELLSESDKGIRRWLQKNK
uniref:Photosystem I reaction center subunit N, chloroplastic n=1 Tax=Anthurium amnicola TaxID=1678845 RepID=A0A1D1Y4K3_9ARAE